MQPVSLAVLLASFAAGLQPFAAAAPVSPVTKCQVKGPLQTLCSIQHAKDSIQVQTLNGYKGYAGENVYLQATAGTFTSQILYHPGVEESATYGDAGAINGIAEFYALKTDSYDVVIGVKPNSKGTNPVVEYVTFYCKNTGGTVTGVSKQYKSFANVNANVNICGSSTVKVVDTVVESFNNPSVRLDIEHPASVTLTGGLCLVKDSRCDTDVVHVQEAPKPINFVQTIKACPKSNRITYPCKILANPWITPAVVDMTTMKQRPNFSFRFPGLYHAFKASDFEVTINVEQVFKKDGKPLRVGMTPEEKKQIQSKDGLKDVFSVTKVYVRCGRNVPAEKINESDPFNWVLDVKGNKVPNPKLSQFAKTNPKVQVFDFKNAAQSISCGTYTINTEPSSENNVNHISITSIYYPGWYAYGGLCLNYDLTINNEFDDTWATDCPGFVTDSKEAPKKQNFFHHANSEEMKCWDKVPVGAPLAA
ncbi:hypothetical protein HDU79_010841, partial [Rhizoclosmatium sp. JEL0117]